MMPSEDDTPLIEFHYEDTDFELPESNAVSTWIQSVITTEKHQLRHLNYIFCSDEYLHQINVEYLNHDTYTDIITFPFAESPLVESDIFISVDRVRENAISFNTTFESELRRVIIHGVLHLCGYRDKTEEEKKMMRKKEEEYI